ncbi:enoyl-CoA hydratase/isomerase family protein [Streptomyces sp. NPDC059467]|uniref:enoyl-CoA hydratase/isomerase family protein n=1 Tax=Streptomyces sp. NPDC059467 TaxID=3346844 RepID=UPI00368D4963
MNNNQTDPAAPLRVVEESPAYWRVVFDNPPLNVVDSAVYEGLQDLLTRMDTNEDLRVVVFESANPDFFLAHFDMSGQSNGTGRKAGPTGLSVTVDTFVRLSRHPVVSISKIRGRARGVGSEFALATDMRFASRENAVLAQPEVGAGVIPGGGGTERLPRLTGRGRALEIILGADDFDAETAERYGWINRALPDAELDDFVDALARRLGSFDRGPIAAAKNLVDQVTLPAVGELLDGQAAFSATFRLPETRKRVAALFARGLQQEGDLENDMGAHLPHLLDD